MKYFIYLFGTAVAQLAYNNTEGLIRSLKQIGTRKDFASDFEDAFKIFRDVPARRLATARGIPSVSSTSVMKHLRRSYISTCPSEKVLGFSCVCNTKYKDMVIIKDANVESLALMAADITTKHIVVTYRPTITLKNWIANADYEFVAMDQAPRGVKVHRGFHRFHASIKRKVFASAYLFLKNPKYKDYTVHVTGYSLGGAIATLAAPDWAHFMKRYNFSHPIESYSYSSPRVGNEEFAKYVAASKIPAIRYTNNNDIVPHLPPRSLDYVHAGLEYHFAKGAIKQCSQYYDEDPNCAIKYNFPLSFGKHYFPDGKILPFPPFC